MMYANPQWQNASEQRIAEGYVPNKTDILCGRGKTNAMHQGNLLFKTLIRSSIKEYTKAHTRMEKTIVVNSVVSQLTEAGMRFLKFDTNYNQYVELSSDHAHEKVGRAIRDLIKWDEKGGSRVDAMITSARGQSILDMVVSLNQSAVPNNALSTNATINSQPASSSEYSVDKQRLQTDTIRSELFSTSDVDFRQGYMSLEKMTHLLGAAADSSEENLLVEIAEDILSMESEDSWNHESDSPLPFDSTIHFERQDVETLLSFLGLDQP